MIIHLKHGYVALVGGHLVSSHFSYPVLRWKLYQQVVCGRGHLSCIKRGTTNDGVVGRGAINDKEIDLLSKLLRVHPNGYWQSNSSNEKDLGATESYQRHV